MLSKFYKKKPDDIIWWTDNAERVGEIYFGFDKEKLYSLYRDYPKALSPDEKEIFDRENPFWTVFFREMMRVRFSRYKYTLDEIKYKIANEGKTITEDEWLAMYKDVCKRPRKEFKEFTAHSCREGHVLGMMASLIKRKRRENKKALRHTASNSRF